MSGAESRVPSPQSPVPSPETQDSGLRTQDPGRPSELADPGPPGLGGTWRSGRVLYQMGLLPLYVEKVLERARSSHGEAPPASLSEEIALVQSALAGFWRPASRAAKASPPIHLFIGPPGSGKTTVLCKWLAKSVLAEGRSARVWRLDGEAVNFPGLVDAYGEILKVSVQREWTANGVRAGFDLGFVDLPGVDAHGAGAVERLRDRLGTIAGAQVHLVLNAAYDVSVLLAQARAFAALPVDDIIFTHLDEEKRPAKLWNVVLGTNFTVRFLSGGQNIPGEFVCARAELLIPGLNRV
jgi:flagellar biosynthesis protein FlhF